MREAELANHGITLATEANRQWVELARQIALEIALRHKDRLCSVEDIYRECETRGIKLPDGNWKGGIFRNTQWRFFASVTAEHEGSHGRRVIQWQLSNPFPAERSGNSRPDRLAKTKSVRPARGTLKPVQGGLFQMEHWD